MSYIYKSVFDSDPEQPEAVGRVEEWVARWLGFEPDETQRTVLGSAGRRVALNCTRQWGKSTVTAAKAVHQAATRAESLTLVVSPSARQSGEFVRKAADFTRRLGVKPRGDGDNEISLAFPNGSRLVGLPGNEATVRGFSSVSLLVVDEAAQVSDGMYMTVRPMLAVSGGGLWLMSTPFGKRGFFHREWSAGSGWERIRVTAEEWATMGEQWYRQEYGCEFTDVNSGVFDLGLVERAVSCEVEPLCV